jgi:hypothetical protein
MKPLKRNFSKIDSMKRKLIIAFVIVVMMALQIFFWLPWTFHTTAAQTMTISNVTGNATNATGSVIVKDIGDVVNSTALLSKAIPNIPGNTSELKSANHSYWWQYNVNSTLQ